ncbi:MAG: hypothetical protein GC168_19510 [Candidatus Hydrogenedens sp.]|nr:hypothetical protein [Candidatus Hydrogenedens sp.]
MYRNLVIVAMGAALLGGCGASQPAAPASSEAATPAAAPAAAEETMPYPPMRNFAPVKIGPYDVQPKFEEEIENGHYNFFVEGGEVKAVRVWVGSEDPTGLMVVKTEIENDYNHGHLEIPDPLPAGAELWIEIEDPSDATFKGSTPLEMAS